MRLAARLIPAVAVAVALAVFLAVPRGDASSRPYVTDFDPSGCAANVAFLAAHAEPHFAIECPSPLPAGEVSVTCLPTIWPDECVYPVIRLTAGACLTAAQDEASNSWVLTAYASSGHVPARVRVGGVPDYPGQYGIDDYGECP